MYEKSLNFNKTVRLVWKQNAGKCKKIEQNNKTLKKTKYMKTK